MASIEKRTSQDGEISYRVKVRLKGFPTQSATFERLTDARKWEQQTESAMREGRHFKTTIAKRHTLAGLIERYLKQLETQNPKRHDDVKQKLEWWKEQLGYCSLADLNKALIAEKRDLLASTTGPKKKKRAPGTVNRYYTALSHALSVAVNEWEWLEHHPMRKLSKLKEPRGRIRFLSDGERNKLLDKCKKSRHPYLYTIVVLALSTGARRGEIMNLQWPDVDFNRRVITLHQTKNDERRILPLEGHAFDLMKKHGKVRKINSEFVFPSDDPKKPSGIQFFWNKAVKDAGINNFRFHDLRHSAASYLAMNGASLAEIAEVLGHKTLSMVKRYAHLSEAHTAKVVQRMNEKVFGNGR